MPNLRSRRAIVHLGILLLVLVPLLALPPKHKGLRGIAVVDVSDPKAPKLMPVAILVDDTLYDANTYLAQPRPLAVEPGNVYDVTQAGARTGSIRISEAHQVKGMWYGAGQMATQQQVRAQRHRLATSGNDDERPVLRHSGENDTPPTTSTTPPPQNTNTAEPPPEDEGRPTLRRGKQETPSTPSTPPRSPRSTIPLPQKTTDHPRLLVAISDPSYNDFPSFAFTTKPEFEAQYKKTALGELTKAYATAPIQGRLVGVPGAPTVTDFRIFDLTTRNQPIVVLAARREVTVLFGQEQRARVQWGLIVAQLEDDGSMSRLFSSVTDPDHLDTTPQLTLVDAVDLYGDGRGELLFQQRSDEGRTFAIYGRTREGFTKLFETARPVQ